MERDRSTRVAVAAFAVFAVLLVVALSGDRRREPASGSGLFGSGPGQFVIENPPTWLVALVALVLVIGAIAAFLVLDRDEKLLVVGILAGIVALAIYFYLFWESPDVDISRNVTQTATENVTLSPGTPGGPENVSPGGLGASDDPGAALPSQTVWVLLVLAVGVVAIFALRVGDRREDDETAVATEAASDDEEGSGPADDEVALAAGRAADHLADGTEGADAFENDVFRAWHEMTTLLDLERPGSSTPGEFARAAVAAGLGTEEVRTLTRLFEEVRYAERPAAGREQAAVDALRSIEAAHEVDAAPTDPDRDSRSGGDVASNGPARHDRPGSEHESGTDGGPD